MKIIFLLLLTSTPYLFAQKIEVIHARGKVQTDRYGTLYDIKKGDKLRRKETIITGEKSLCVIKIEDHTTMKIEPNSKIDLYAIKRKKGNSETSIYMQAGNMLMNVVKDYKNLETKVETKLAAFAVRGTTFKTSADSKKTWVAVNEGIVEATSFKQQEDFVDAGEAIFVEPELGFTKPKKYAFVKKIDWGNLGLAEGLKGFAERFGLDTEIDKEYEANKETWFISPAREAQLKELKLRWSAGLKKVEKVSSDFAEWAREMKESIREEERQYQEEQKRKAEQDDEDETTILDLLRN
jgi:F0F1-type ATP synthase epsilon subunit